MERLHNVIKNNVRWHCDDMGIVEAIATCKNVSRDNKNERIEMKYLNVKYWYHMLRSFNLVRRFEYGLIVKIHNPRWFNQVIHYMTDGFYDNRAEIFNVEQGSCQCHRTHQDYISIGCALSQEIVCGLRKTWIQVLFIK